MLNDPRVQALFKRSSLCNVKTLCISQDFYRLPKRTIRANGTLYHVFKPNNFRDFQNLYQYKASMDMKLIEFKYLISTCSDKKYQSVTIGMVRDKYTSRYRLGLNSIFVPDSSPF